MISLHPTTPAHYAALAYQLDEKQRIFTQLPMNYFDNATPTQRCISIMQDEEIVGFFVLDCGEDCLTYTDNRNAILLRSMSINPLHQGKGIARAALSPTVLHPLIRRHFPHCNEIILGVNHANQPAIKLYQNIGFIDTGRTYMGVKGLQYIFHKVLSPHRICS